MMPFSFDDKDVVVFDLDDTLYKEIEYLESQYKLISIWLKEHYLVSSDVFEKMMEWHSEGRDVFRSINSFYHIDVPISTYLDIYRYQKPHITLPKDSFDVLSELKTRGVTLGLMSDGRVLTQMNKIESLKIASFFSDDMIIISESFGSEKPNEVNYWYFMNACPEKLYTYIGDNIAKDFISANTLGWRTICLKDDGRNIHRKNFGFTEEYLPQITIGNLNELLS